VETDGGLFTILMVFSMIWQRNMSLAQPVHSKQHCCVVKKDGKSLMAIKITEADKD
jgi:hypothetical protein